MKRQQSQQQQKETATPVVVDTYETEIEYTCPVRGRVKQKVKVKRLAPIFSDPDKEVLSTKNVTEELDSKFSGLHAPDDSLDEQPHKDENADRLP